ncbi:hypothetical protein CBR_g30382 [Chara braunii]|uniref:Uncharacterized protein n=1 Tax=Chara braunii TaxID=69332 RepID=A0A388JXC7_CHABU|nr:hypothetical protein CBR_g30382 [Chara braunii]|eukprot:GBG62428.1 hypothetical protein CBR_g30382 [Chara braunii]
MALAVITDAEIENCRSAARNGTIYFLANRGGLDAEFPPIAGLEKGRCENRPLLHQKGIPKFPADLSELKKPWNAGRPYLKCTCPGCEKSFTWFDHMIWYIIGNLDRIDPFAPTDKIRMLEFQALLRTTWRKAILAQISVIFMREYMIKIVNLLTQNRRISAEEILEYEDFRCVPFVHKFTAALLPDAEGLLAQTANARRNVEVEDNSLRRCRQMRLGTIKTYLAAELNAFYRLGEQQSAFEACMRYLSKGDSAEVNVTMWQYLAGVDVDGPPISGQQYQDLMASCEELAYQQQEKYQNCNRFCDPQEASICCDSLYLPGFDLTNLVGLPLNGPRTDDTWAIPLNETFGKPLMTRIVIFQGTFSTPLDFHRFPFDTQQLQIEVNVMDLYSYIVKSRLYRGQTDSQQSQANNGNSVGVSGVGKTIQRSDELAGWEVTSMRWSFSENNNEEPSVTNYEEYATSDPWRRVLNVTSELDSSTESNTNLTSCKIQILIKRTFNFNFYTIVFPSMCTVFLALLPLLLSPTEIELRFSSTVTLFLALVALQYTTTSSADLCRRLPLLLLVAVLLLAVVIYHICILGRIPGRKQRRRTTKATGKMEKVQTKRTMSVGAGGSSRQRCSSAEGGRRPYDPTLYSHLPSHEIPLPPSDDDSDDPRSRSSTVPLGSGSPQDWMGSQLYRQPSTPTYTDLLEGRNPVGYDAGLVDLNFGLRSGSGQDVTHTVLVNPASGSNHTAPSVGPWGLPDTRGRGSGQSGDERGLVSRGRGAVGTAGVRASGTRTCGSTTAADAVHRGRDDDDGYAAEVVGREVWDDYRRQSRQSSTSAITRGVAKINVGADDTPGDCDGAGGEDCSAGDGGNDNDEDEDGEMEILADDMAPRNPSVKARKDSGAGDRGETQRGRGHVPRSKRQRVKEANSDHTGDFQPEEVLMVDSQGTSAVARLGFGRDGVSKEQLSAPKKSIAVGAVGASQRTPKAAGVVITEVRVPRQLPAAAGQGQPRQALPLQQVGASGGGKAQSEQKGDATEIDTQTAAADHNNRSGVAEAAKEDGLEERSKLWVDCDSFWGQGPGKPLREAVGECADYFIAIANGDAGAEPPAMLIVPQNDVLRFKIENPAQREPALRRARSVEKLLLRAIHGWIFKSSSRSAGFARAESYISVDIATDVARAVWQGQEWSTALVYHTLAMKMDMPLWFAGVKIVDRPEDDDIAARQEKTVLRVAECWTNALWCGQWADGGRVKQERLSRLADCLRALLSACMWIMRMRGDDGRSHYEACLYSSMVAKPTMIAAGSYIFNWRRDIVDNANLVLDRIGKAHLTLGEYPHYIPEWCDCGLVFGHNAALKNAAEAAKHGWIGSGPAAEEEGDEDG